MCKWFSFNSLKLNAQAKDKVQNNRGYAPELAWVRYNQVSFHLGGMIIKSPSASATPDDSAIQHRSYHEIRGYNVAT